MKLKETRKQLHFLAGVRSEKQKIYTEAYSFDEYEERFRLGNAEVRCPHCGSANRPWRKKEEPKSLTEYCVRCNEYFDGYDLCAYYRTRCSCCKKEFNFSHVYRQ